MVKVAVRQIAQQIPALTRAPKPHHLMAKNRSDLKKLIIN
jgi:hypothetical protein